MRTIISGFVVVRLPHLNYLVPGRDAVPCVTGVCYAGVDRQRWIDVFDQDFYSKRIPESTNASARKVKSGSNDFTGIDLCQNKDEAVDLLRHANRKAVSNELIAIRSRSLDAIKGNVEVDLNAEWIGYDFVALGDWSLIGGGIFSYPTRYSRWLDRINGFGLFDNPSSLPEYVLSYEQAVIEGESEPLSPLSAGFDKVAIEIGRVHVDQRSINCAFL